MGVASMKMKPADYAALVRSVAPLHTGRRLSRYAQAGLSAERYRWDLLWKSGFPVESLYHYLTDNHIDTALRRITHTT